MLLMPAKPKEDVYVTVCSEKKKKKKVQVTYVFMSWAHKGSEDTSNFKKDREGSALGIVWIACSEWNFESKQQG